MPFFLFSDYFGFGCLFSVLVTKVLDLPGWTNLVCMFAGSIRDCDSDLIIFFLISKEKNSFVVAKLLVDHATFVIG